jgi:hypothetical protein
MNNPIGCGPVSYQQAFQRLLRDLKAEGKESVPGS